LYCTYARTVFSCWMAWQRRVWTHDQPHKE